MKQIINLHVHSHYSGLDSIASPNEIVDRTKEMGLPSVAITDHGNMNNWGTFYKYAKNQNIKPILGCEFYTIDNLKKWNEQQYYVKNNELSPEEKEYFKKVLNVRNHLIILVKNEIGFKNINNLINQSYRNFYYRPRIDKELLEKYHEGLICSSACLAGEIQQYLLNEDEVNAERIALWYKNLFGDDFYLEVQFNEIEDQAKINLKIIELAKKLNIKTIITPDSHYLKKGDEKTHQTLLLLQTKKTYAQLDKKDAWEFSASGLYLKSYEEFWEACQKYNPEITLEEFDKMASNTIEIDKKINILEINAQIKLKDVNPTIEDKSKFLFEICNKKLKELNLDEKYQKRLFEELNVIKEKKLENYFLIVSKITSDARKKMLVGAARGSSGGSLVNYLLGINEIDPIKYELLFSRFLSLQRSDYPDIDIDFERNNEVKEDLINEYGTDVALVSNYNTFQYAGLLKDLCRTYGIETPEYLNKLNKMIQQEILQTLEVSTKIENIGKSNDVGPGNAIIDEENLALSEITSNYNTLIESSNSLKDFLIKYPKIEYDFQRLLGKIKHIGKHAAGVIISDDLINNQPLMVIEGKQQTSLSEGTQERLLSDYGFVKIDILGLSTLSIIHNTLKIIAKKQNIDSKELYNKLIHPDKINIEDKKVYNDIFNCFNLLGIFQFETDSMKGMINKTKPSCFEDLIAMNALFRPGPIASGIAFEYGDRKRGLILSDYYNHDICRKILNKTHGIIAYQEQVMLLGNQLGKFTLDETNTLRKLLMKMKKTDLKNNIKLIEAEEKFKTGALENGMSEIDTNRIWQDMVNFAKYSFNRAHSVGYAMIAYQCAFLKTYYPLEFYCALLQNEESDNFGKIVSEARNRNILILPIDINNSEKTFAIKEGKIYFGFSNLKGCGEKATESIIKSRDNKPFKGLADFLSRDDMEWRHVNKRVVETLIHVGVFDFGKDQRELLLLIYEKFCKIRDKLSKKVGKWTLENRLEILKQCHNEAINEIENLPTSDEKKMNWELEHYKFNIEYSPFTIGERKIKIETMLKSGKIGNLSEDYKYWIVLFKEIKRFKDKNGREMCFVDLTDHTGRKEQGIIFSSAYNANLIKQNNIYLIEGNKDSKIIIKKYRNIDEF